MGDAHMAPHGPTSATYHLTETNALHTHHRRKKLILCFDGTGNKFKGNDGDTNILKIFRMLDRSGSDQFHYYQPGIGTYLTNGTLSRVNIGSRIKSWYQKALDAAVGTSFDQHVVGGYKFLMRFYAPGDDIYLFGFSRGAYTARFLSEMLDYVGLVSQGNEEMVMFAWKTFSNWQQRQGEEEEEMYEYMRAFRETFARPVRRVRFLGLFDTVNSVPRFEKAWLKRATGFPYTARSSALVIRHAVGIDERRAKFRQDLVEKISPGEVEQLHTHAGNFLLHAIEKHCSKMLHPNADGSAHQNGKAKAADVQHHQHPRFGGSEESLSVASDAASRSSFNIHRADPYDRHARAAQDIEEVWFPGAHGDIGGGWDLPEGEEPLSHGPLVWMVREARKAGVVFDKDSMKQMNCWMEEFETDGLNPGPSSTPTGATHPVGAGVAPGPGPSRPAAQAQPGKASDHVKAIIACKPDPVTYLEKAYTRGKIHDCLCYPSGGLSLTGTIGWKMMEYLPFRRMDLKKDGTWEPIIWPLPCGEVRDIPDNAKVHNSVIKRMQADPKYRPGNLLLGGGGRGVRVAPKRVGMGEWVLLREEGSLVGEVWVKKRAVDNGLVEKEKA